MSALAEFVMKGRAQAILVSVVTLVYTAHVLAEWCRGGTSHNEKRSEWGC